MDYCFGGTSAARGHARAPDPTTIGECSRRRVRLISLLRKDDNGCDHTCTNALDPIRTLQCSVLWRE
jgi:hypothetical protein